MTNPLAYNAAALITTVKSLTVQIPGRQKRKEGKKDKAASEIMTTIIIKRKT